MRDFIRALIIAFAAAGLGAFASSPSHAADNNDVVDQICALEKYTAGVKLSAAATQDASIPLSDSMPSLDAAYLRRANAEIACASRLQDPLIRGTVLSDAADDMYLAASVEHLAHGSWSSSLQIAHDVAEQALDTIPDVPYAAGLRKRAEETLKNIEAAMRNFATQP